VPRGGFAPLAPSFVMALGPFAPGWPGIEPRWTSSAKSGVGTALTATSRVWLNEIYYVAPTKPPRVIVRPQAKDSSYPIRAAKPVGRMPFAMAPTQTSGVPPVLFFDDASLEGVVAWVDGATNWFHTSDWQRLQCQAMRRDFGWELPAQRYLAL
jgi:hypothetical protein